MLKILAAVVAVVVGGYAIDVIRRFIKAAKKLQSLEVTIPSEAIDFVHEYLTENEIPHCVKPNNSHEKYTIFTCYYTKEKQKNLILEGINEIKKNCLNNCLQ